MPSMSPEQPTSTKVTCRGCKHSSYLKNERMNIVKVQCVYPHTMAECIKNLLYMSGPMHSPAYSCKKGVSR